MVKILVVDDEPIITDGLYALLCQACDDYNVYKTYSASEALALLDSIRMDIVLSDIKMPGMDGIEMLSQIKKRWPTCHVLFLSGYSDFEYVQSAMQLGADTYILKSQGDEVILENVAQTVQLLREEQCNTFWQTHLQEELKKAQPLLCQEFLWKLLLGELKEPAEMEHSFLRLGLPIQPKSPLLLVGGRIDRPLNGAIEGYPTELPGQIDAVFTAYLSSKVNTVNVCWSRRYLCWMIQPLDQTHTDYDALRVFLLGMLEKVQEHCLNQLNASVSLVVDPAPYEWSALSSCFSKMRSILTYQLSANDEMLLGHTSFFDSHVSPVRDTSQGQAPDVLLHGLSVALDYRQRREYDQALNALLDYLAGPQPAGQKIAAYHRLCVFFLEQINGTGLDRSFWDTFHSYEIFSLPFEQWENTLHSAFGSLSNWLFEELNKSHTQRFRQMVYTLHQYIDTHLNDDLSVNALAEIVYLNPVYLSRAYRQATGNKLSEYVLARRIERAKQLLRQPEKKVSEIAYQVGFESAAHFSRVFKKLTGKTPQEYRSAQIPYGF